MISYDERKVTTRRDLAVASVDRYLANHHSTLWGQFFDLTSDARRHAAAEWFVDQMAAWARYSDGDEEFIEVPRQTAIDALQNVCAHLGIEATFT